MNSIIFVYNADSGPIRGLIDLMHKIVSPSTYPCSLCAITYGTLGMHHEWREFIDRLDHPVEFLHKDELAAQYGLDNVPLPAAFTKSEDGKLSIFMDSEVLNSLSSLAELKSALSRRIADMH